MASMNSANVSLDLRNVEMFPAIAKELAPFDDFITFFTLLIEISDKHYIVFFCAEIKKYYTNSPNESLEN